MADLPAILDATPGANITRASEAAGACKAIVASTAQNIQGRKYVRVEGWQSIAIAHGCVASSRDVELVETGIRAIGEVRRMDTGAVIATAEGFVGNDEPTWAKRSEYARRAMAQTRAISRACRSAFAHIVVMMNAGLETTPAEEMPDHDEPPQPRKPPSKPAGDPKIVMKPDELRTRRLAVFKRVSALAQDDPGGCLKALTAAHGHPCANLSDMTAADVAWLEGLSETQLRAAIAALNEPGPPPDEDNIPETWETPA